MTITKNTLSTSSWDTVYNLLQTGTYALTTNNIYSAYNSKLAKSVGYPIVIIDPPNINFDKVTIHGGTTESQVIFNITVYHNSAQNVKALYDSVQSSLLNGRYVLQGAGLKNMKIDASDYDFWNEGDKKVHFISFPVNFRYLED